jgi:hypothetical protein
VVLWICSTRVYILALGNSICLAILLEQTLVTMFSGIESRSVRSTFLTSRHGRSEFVLQAFHHCNAFFNDDYQRNAGESLRYGGRLQHGIYICYARVCA